MTLSIKGVALAIGFVFAAPVAFAEDRIQRVISPGGIEAWLVEEHAIPMIAVEIGWEGGARLDPDEALGAAYFVSGMVEEGAGPYDSQQFAARLEELSARMSYDTTREGFYIGMRTLTGTRDESFDLLRIALTEAHFEDEPLERVRDQILVGIENDTNDPNAIAAKAWYAEMLPDTPYARPMKGTAESVAALSADDLRASYAAMTARSRMKIGVVGDIDAETLGPLLDKTFGDLPMGEPFDAGSFDVRGGGGLRIIEEEVPQSVVMFGHEGLLRDDPDFLVAYVLNHILGGGGFESRLTDEVREKRGLAYSVYSYLNPFRGAGLYMGGVATSNERVAESIDIIRAEWAKLAEEGVSAEELEDAKKYLTGSYALRFDSNAKIARYLVGAQMTDLGIDYIDVRNGLVEAITLEDMKRVAARLLQPEDLFTVVVGMPEGLEE